jgi:hypothetical protein
MADDPTPPEPKPDPKPDPELGDAGKKALEAERAARRDADKQLRAVQEELKKLQDKDKSETDRLRDEVEQLKAQSAEGAAKALRAEVALSKGLSAAHAKRLVGTTREELEADADEILEAFPSPGGGATPPPGKRPVPDLKGGTDPSDTPVETNPAKLAASVPRGF